MKLKQVYALLILGLVLLSRTELLKIKVNHQIQKENQIKKSNESDWNPCQRNI
jgi:hypothetical protein